MTVLTISHNVNGMKFLILPKSTSLFYNFVPEHCKNEVMQSSKTKDGITKINCWNADI